MSLMADKWIAERAHKDKMIEPFCEEQVRKTEDGKKLISYGLSSYGYDARVASDFKIFTDVDSAIVDPKNFAAESFVTREGDIIIPPNSFALAHTVEYFRVPEDVLVVCLGKSTYARCGIIVNVTPLEPGWEGQVTIEISNTTPLPARIYANEGICQFLFFKGNEPCTTTYAKRAGKYMNQKGVTLPRSLISVNLERTQHIMDAFRIQGGQKLSGEIVIGGAKNSALKLMAASLLAKGDVHLSNVPDIADVRLMCQLLETLGVGVTRHGPNDLTIGGTVTSNVASYDIVSKMRASILVLGPLLARFGEASVSLPGGCAIGSRPVDLHLFGLERLGAEIVLDKGYIHAKHKGRLQGNKIPLSFPSVGATENIMMAATLAEGETTLINAAQEPEIKDLASFLNKMGAKITGAGTSTITIHGVSELTGCEYSVMPDRLEAGTYAIAAMMTEGDLLLKHAGYEGQELVFPKLAGIGCTITDDANGIRVVGKPKLIGGLDIKTEPHPGFPTDMQAQFTALLSVSEGTSMVTETVFENRFMHVAELNRMGANITLKGNTAMIKGVNQLSGAKVMATDLRASFSLILSALYAQGETEISRIYHLDRGYENVERKLGAVGAKISRFKQ